jgi:hypothetical protein
MLKAKKRMQKVTDYKKSVTAYIVELVRVLGVKVTDYRFLCCFLKRLYKKNICVMYIRNKTLSYIYYRIICGICNLLVIYRKSVSYKVTD